MWDRPSSVGQATRSSPLRRVVAAGVRLRLRDRIERAPRLGVVALAFRGQCQLACRTMQQPDAEVPLQRCDVPAHIRLAGREFAGDRGKTSGFDHTGETVHEQQSVHA
jgi:hypothetical protein